MTAAQHASGVRYGARYRRRRARPTPPNQLRYLAGQLQECVGRLAPKQDRGIVCGVALALLMVADELETTDDDARRSARTITMARATTLPLPVPLPVPLPAEETP